MAKTKVLEAPYHPNGSLLHYPGDYHEFSHYEDTRTGERLERDQIWERIPVENRELNGTPWGSVEKTIHMHWKTVRHQPEWRPNLPFHGTFQVDSVRSGRSAKYVILRPFHLPLDLRTFPMFVTDLIDVARERGISIGGGMSGRWMVAKRGQNYGLRMAKEDE